MPLPLILLLLLFSETAAQAASQGLKLWAKQVLPTLFPFFVALGLMENAGLMDGGAGGVRGRVLCIVGGAVSGYPAGARLCAGNGFSRLAPYCNLCSPAFLLGVIGGEMLGSRMCAIGVMLAHYIGSGVCCLAEGLFCRLFYKKRAKDAITPPQNAGSTSAAPRRRSFAAILADSAMSMLGIGGCIVCFMVLSALLHKIGLFALIARPLALLGWDKQAVWGVLLGLMEMTGGCDALSALAIPIRWKTALFAFLISFGGCSTAMQTALFLPKEEMKRYVLLKLFQGALAMAAAYLISPLFSGGSLPAMQVDIGAVKTRSVALASILGSSLIGIAFTYLAALVLRNNRR